MSALTRFVTRTRVVSAFLFHHVHDAACGAAAHGSQGGLVSGEEREGGDQERGDGAGAQSGSLSRPALQRAAVQLAARVVIRIADAVLKCLFLRLTRQGCNTLGFAVARVHCLASAFLKTCARFREVLAEPLFAKLFELARAVSRGIRNGAPFLNRSLRAAGDTCCSLGEGRIHLISGARRLCERCSCKQRPDCNEHETQHLRFCRCAAPSGKRVRMLGVTFLHVDMQNDRFTPQHGGIFCQ